MYTLPASYHWSSLGGVRAVPGFEVDPGSLAAAGGQLSGLAPGYDGLASSLQAAFAAISAAGGDGGVGSAAEAASGRWATTVQGLGTVVEGLGSGVSAAAGSYRSVEGGVRSGFSRAAS